MKKNLKIFLILLIILVAFVSINLTNADSGWDTSYDSGGGSSSWASDSSSYDWGDSDYTSSSRVSSSSPASISIIIFTSSLTFIIFIFILIYIFNLKNYVNSVTNIKNQFFDIKETRLKEILPDINLSELKQIILDKFIDIQNAWMEFDYDKLRELCTDELYNAYKTQLEILKMKNGKNVMKDFTPVEIKITDLNESNGIITIMAFLHISFFDYVIDVTTNVVTRGTNKNKISNNYMLTFIVAKDNIKRTDKCPNCGAKIDSTISTTCKYCDSIIVHEAKDFVLSKKTNINK